MTNRQRLSERLSITPGTRRSITGEEFRDMQRAAVELEQRAEQAERRASLTVAEPITYRRGGPDSFFADLGRNATGLGDTTGAKQRLERHELELAATYPQWRQARARAASAAYESAFASDRRGEQLLERMEKYGLAKFRADDAFERELLHEKRSISRAEASAGYFTPPLWALEDWAGAARAGRPFANLCWQSMPLPPGCASVNIPHWTTGLATGPQGDGAPVATSSAADSFATSNVVTIAGTQDVAMQFMEQTAPPGYDVFLGSDLTADAGGSLDAQLLIGGGTGQLNGIIVSGAASAANLVLAANTQNVSGSTLVAAEALAGDVPVWTTVGDMLYTMAKARGVKATHVVMHPGLWEKIAGTLDGNGRPILLPSADAPQPSPDGVLGEAWGKAVIGTGNMPLTFGGTSAPTVAASGGYGSASTAGNGTGTVIAAVRASDLFLFEGDIRIRVFQDVASGTGQWRYQILQYVAALRDRYTWAGSNLSYTNGTDTVTLNTGGTPSAGVTTNYETNSPLAGL